MTDLIADLPNDEKPRERLLLHGAETLSDAEVLAVLLGSGVPGKNAIQLARELLTDGFAALRRRGAVGLARTSGVGPAKAARIAAAFEVSRRLASAIGQQEVYAADAVTPALMHRYGHAPQEHLGAIFLDSRMHMLRQREIYVGTVNQAIVSTRDVVRHALEENAKNVVLFHNHPSGDPSPSAEDLVFTRKMKQSLALVDVDLIDHFVIGASRYVSMRDRGVLT